MFNFFSSTTPDDVAMVAAFIGGVGMLVISYASYRGIKEALKVLFTPTRQMAKRN